MQEVDVTLSSIPWLVHPYPAVAPIYYPVRLKTGPNGVLGALTGRSADSAWLANSIAPNKPSSFLMAHLSRARQNARLSPSVGRVAALPSKRSLVRRWRSRRDQLRRIAISAGDWMRTGVSLNTPAIRVLMAIFRSSECRIASVYVPCVRAAASMNSARDLAPPCNALGGNLSPTSASGLSPKAPQQRGPGRSSSWPRRWRGVGKCAGVNKGRSHRKISVSHVE